MTAAVIITTDHGVTFRDVSGLKAMQDIVGGWIEALQLGDGSTMYVNEEGRPRQLPFNSIASDVCGLGGRPDLMQRGIVGNVLIVGPVDGEGEDTDLTEAARSWVTRVAEEA